MLFPYCQNWSKCTTKT